MKRYLILFLLTGCVTHHAHVTAPSTAPVQGSINKAKSANTEAQRFNDINMTTGERIEAKSKVIQKYWK